HHRPSSAEPGGAHPPGGKVQVEVLGFVGERVHPWALTLLVCFPPPWAHDCAAVANRPLSCSRFRRCTTVARGFTGSPSTGRRAERPRRHRPSGERQWELRTALRAIPKRDPAP